MRSFVFSTGGGDGVRSFVFFMGGGDGVRSFSFSAVGGNGVRSFCFLHGVVPFGSGLLRESDGNRRGYGLGGGEC